MRSLNEIVPGSEIVAPDGSHSMTLLAFVKRNRAELEACCRAKRAERHAPLAVPSVTSPGVSRFLQQLVNVLESERRASVSEDRTPRGAAAVAKIGPIAAVHGSALWHQGFTVNQVVHDYGDVCQSITELAIQQRVNFTSDEFRILNRCLDLAIAHAVTGYQDVAQQTVVQQQGNLHAQVLDLMRDHQRLLGIAHQSFLAIKSGHVGIAGATGTLLAHAIDELMRVADERLPQVVEALRLIAD